MAKRILDNAYLTIDASELKTYIKSITLNYEKELHDTTTMGDGGKTRTSGFQDWSLDVTFWPDSSGTLDALLWAWVGESEAVTCKPEDAATAAGNPIFSGNGIVQGYEPIKGEAGSPHETSVTIVGNGALARATS